VHARAAEVHRVELRALEQPVDVGLPGEADAAVQLDRGGGDAAPRLRRRGLGHRRRLGQALRRGVGRPGRVVGQRPRALDVAEHLRRGVLDGLERADGHAELPAVLDVGERHVERAAGHADELGRHGHERAVERLAGRQRSALHAAVAARRVDGLDALAPERHAVEPDDESGPARVRDERLARAERAHGLAGGKRGRLRRGQRRQRGAQERHGRDGVAELLGQHRELDDPEPLAAPLLTHGDARPAQLAQLAPQRLVEAVLLERRGTHALPRRAAGEQLARGALDLLLVLVEVESHVRSPAPSAGAAAPGRAPRRCS